MAEVQIWRIDKTSYLACLSYLALVLLFYGFVLRLIDVNDYSAIVLMLSQIEIKLKFTVFILKIAEITRNLGREGVTVWTDERPVITESLAQDLGTSAR